MKTGVNREAKKFTLKHAIWFVLLIMIAVLIIWSMPNKYPVQGEDKSGNIVYLVNKSPLEQRKCENFQAFDNYSLTQLESQQAEEIPGDIVVIVFTIVTPNGDVIEIIEIVPLEEGDTIHDENAYGVDNI